MIEGSILVLKTDRDTYNTILIQGLRENVYKIVLRMEITLDAYVLLESHSLDKGIVLMHKKLTFSGW